MEYIYDGYKLPLTGEVYKHYKGNKYIVIDHAQYTERNMLLVLYKRYDKKDDSCETIWARPLNVWNETVTLKDTNEKVQRFTRVEECLTKGDENDKLLTLHPCPICGGKMIIKKVRFSNGMDGSCENWDITCSSCKLVKTGFPADCFYGREYLETEEEAIKQWNKTCENICELTKTK